MDEKELKIRHFPEVSQAFEKVQWLPSKIPTSITQWEQSLPKKYAGNISNPLKALKKLYADIDTFYKYVLPETPCSKGCNSCCHYDVSISELEAKYIEKGTGVRRAIPMEMTHRNNSYVPCTFLDSGKCSIYEYRPYACRTHVTFTPTPFWCEPGRVEEHAFPMTQLNSFMFCIKLICASSKHRKDADIRDFFPKESEM